MNDFQQTEADERVVDGRAIELSIVVPTLNEVDNVTTLVGRLRAILATVSWELIIVDDNSTDGTAAAVRAIARRDLQVRCLERIGRRGLASACIEGMLASSAPFIAVMDADLQHDERVLPRMLEILHAGEADIVVASRYIQGGGVDDWDKGRISISRLATRLGRAVLRADVSDPMSGFFMLSRETMEAAVHNLSGIGFKILFDLFASSPERLRVREVPYQFRARQRGASKLDSKVAWDYMLLLLDKLSGHVVPVRFLSFCIVGGTGVAIHFAVLLTAYKGLGVDFVVSHSIATGIAMTSNYVLNNVLTYSDMRHRGWQLLRGWATFVAVCGFGALANVGIAAQLFSVDTNWILSAAAGIVVGTVWNYVASSFYTWKASSA